MAAAAAQALALRRITNAIAVRDEIPVHVRELVAAHNADPLIERSIALREVCGAVLVQLLQ
jgi:hypothetical protein